MPETHSQQYIPFVFAAIGREIFIARTWHDVVHKYIAGTIHAKEQQPIIVNGRPDHIHSFIRLKPSMAISDLVRDVKNNSSN